MIAPGSALSILLREGEKKRKQKSIRSLLTETGELVQRIKPCFLMLPLSVSTFLAPDSVHFDVVVFDEALAIQCGVTRVGKAINEAMDSALHMLDNSISIDGEQITLK